MCYRNVYHLRCGHPQVSALLLCTSATRNPRTGRYNKCGARTARYNIDSDNLCGDEEDCPLSACHGRWICCKCRFGHRPGEINRNTVCVAGHCSHKICWGCLSRTEENIRDMYAEDGSEDSAEMEEATREDLSDDSIIFSDNIDDDDVAE